MRLFGAFALFGADGVSLTPRGRRACALLAYLALSPSQSAPRERLADIFWGGRGEEQARASLRQCLAEIRSAIGELPLIEADRDRIWLAQGQSTTDFSAVLTALATGSAIEAAHALKQLAGAPLLDGLKATPEFAAWVRDTAERLARELNDAVLIRLRTELSGGDRDAARLISDAYLDLAPDAEDVVAIAMESDIARGDLVAATRRFERLRAYLERELDVAPGPAVSQLHASLAAHAAPSRPIEQEQFPPLVLVPIFERAALENHDGYLAIALREEILAGLSRFRDIRLSSDERRQIADSLSHADAARAYQIVGTLLMSGNGWKLIMRVTQLAERRVIWAETLELGNAATATGIAAMVRRIIGMVLPAVNEDFFQRLPPVANAMYDRYLVAKHRSFHATTLPEMQAAANELEAIIRDVPGFAPAYPPLIRLLNTDYYYTGFGLTGERERHRAFELARTALQLDPHDVHGHTVLGFCHLWLGRADAARERFAHALALNPFHAVRVSEAATGQMYLGDLDAAEELLNRSLELKFGPDDSYREDAGRLCLMRGNGAGALMHLEKIIQPTLWSGLYSCLARAQIGQETARAFARWRESVAESWQGATALDADALAKWIDHHHPFVEPLRAAFNNQVAALLQ